MNRSNILKYSLIVLLGNVALSSVTLSTYGAEPPIQLANSYYPYINLKNYWVSEKLDGVRAYWDGKQFISKQGYRINAPDWFIQNFPADVLDGELWIGRNQFELVSGIIRQQTPDDARWRKVRFMVFDMPKNPAIFTQRLAAMKQLIASTQSEYIQLIAQFSINTHDDLIKELTNTVKNGGEGLMLHRGDSLYRAERNDDLLKVKAFQDAEATVIDYVPGKGKYQNMLGALLVENADKVRFKLGSGFTDQQRQNPPPIGSIITYKYFGKTKNNTPKFASFIRVRGDIVNK